MYPNLLKEFYTSKDLMVLSLYIQDTSETYLKTIVSYRGRQGILIELSRYLNSIQLTVNFIHQFSGHKVKPSDITSFNTYIDRHKEKLKNK